MRADLATGRLTPGEVAPTPCPPDTDRHIECIAVEAIVDGHDPETIGTCQVRAWATDGQPLDGVAASKRVQVGPLETGTTYNIVIQTRRATGNPDFGFWEADCRPAAEG